MSAENKDTKPEEQHEHKDGCCDHDHGAEEAKTCGKAEKKVRKALSKLGMQKMEGVNRVTMKQKDSYILIVKDPEVFTSPQNENTFIIFGELTFDDPEKKMSQEAIEQMKKEGEKLETSEQKATEQKVEVVQEEGKEISEEGLSPESIELVMTEGKCTRQQAVKALKAHDGDTVEALLEINQ